MLYSYCGQNQQYITCSYLSYGEIDLDEFSILIILLQNIRHWNMQFAVHIVNPWRACAARVTVVVLSVCVSTTILALQATRRLENENGDIAETTAFESDKLTRSRTAQTINKRCACVYFTHTST